MPQPRYLLALDQGTTSSRAIVFDDEGAIRAIAQKEFPQHYPQPGWVEHDPEDIWNTQRDTALEALRTAKLTVKDIAALGVTNQRETTVLWERATGRAVHPAIVWQDRRTADICAALAKDIAEDWLRARTGLRLDPYFSGTKLAWLLDTVPGARARAERGELCFGTVDTWLLWKLTGGKVHATDPSNASRTLLFNMHKWGWDDELLTRFRIPRAILPEVRPSSGVFGEVSAVPELRGLAIAGIAGDQQAALFGQACFEPGLAKNTYGTGCFMLMQTGDECPESRNHLLTTVAWEQAGRRCYALEGSIFIAGAVVQWLRDGLGIIQNAAEVEALAASVPDAGGVYFVPAFAGLGAPHWDAFARGTLLGLTRGTTKAHLARAALEAIAFQNYDVLDAMQRDAGRPLRELRVDGGASANSLLMQFQADLLGVPVVRPKVTETTALGAANLAGLAVGLWPEAAALAAHWQMERVFQPQKSRDEMDARLARWREAVSRSMAWEPRAKN
jgi:glycerol kinase